MAKGFKLLCIVWLIVAFSSASSVSADGEVTEAPPDVTEAPPDVTEAPPDVTEAPPDVTEAPPDVTEAPPDVTEAPPDVTEAPPDVTEAPPDVTEAPPDVTEAPPDVTEAPPDVTEAPPEASTTTTPPDGTTSTNPGNTTPTPDPTTTTQKPTTTTPPPGPCDSSPCGRGSTCDPRADQTFVCLCLPGEVYNEGRGGCDNAKVFPRDLNLPGLPYDPKMEDKTSQEFKKASVRIIDALSPSFKNTPGYIDAIVVEIQPASTTTRVLREVDVKATVDIIFDFSSEVKSDAVDNVIKKAVECENCVLAGGSFTVKDLCDSNTCDSETTNCTSGDGTFTCDCSDGYVKTDFSDRVCVACPSGEQAKGSPAKCEACSFGYSGFNCNESWKLALVIVGSVLGGLLLISLILLPVVADQFSKKSSKSKDYEDIGTSYADPPPAKLPLYNGTRPAQPVNGFADAAVPKIPRATTNNWDSRTNLEMTQSNSRQNLISADRNSRLHDDQDDLSPYAQSRPGSYAQARPQNNPYAQRPQVNPYAQSQGQSNPYYSGRRFN